MTLLRADDPPPFRVLNRDSDATFFLTADHAGRVFPAVLGDMGLPESEQRRHIAYDIGIGEVTIRLADLLGATAVLQTYSRLVIDCNRQPGVASAFPEISEATRIPGNEGLSEADKRARIATIFDPYHSEIERLIARRARKPVYVAMHSFTPVYLGVRRPMQIALLYNRNPVLSRHLLELLTAEGDLVVAENDPYRVSDETDYGVPVHAERRWLDYLEIEIRQDLIETEADQTAWATRLARLLPMAAAKLTEAGR